MIQEKSNNEVFLRPRFTIETDKSEESVLNSLETLLKVNKNQFSCKQRDRHIFIDICEKDSHFWSPQLHIEVLQGQQNGSLVKGLFGPKPQVWTFFMFLHFAVGIAFCVFVTFLYVNHTLDKSVMFPLLMTILLPIIWVFLYFIGRLGRDFGKKQMHKMHDLLLESIEKA